MNNRKKFILDLILNLLAAIIPIAILQFISFPLIALNSGAQEYGSVISIISIITIIGFPIGNVLCNTRLLLNEKYESYKVIGDFNLMLIFGISFSALISWIVLYVYIPRLDFINLILIILIICMSVLKDYYIVYYRLNLNYLKNLIANFLLAFGYAIGTLIFIFTEIWQMIYISGLILILIYIFKTTNLYKEGFRKTKHFTETYKMTKSLYIVSLGKNLVNNADKVLILPILGAGNAAIYYTATILGKIILMVITPINNVMLSYLVKTKKFSSKKLLIEILCLIVFSIPLYYIVLFSSDYFLNIMYSEWSQESLEIINYTTISSLVLMVSLYLQPYNLRFNKIKWQFYMVLSQIIIYTGGLILYYPELKLINFVLITLISNIFITLVQIIIIITFRKEFSK